MLSLKRYVLKKVLAKKDVIFLFKANKQALLKMNWPWLLINNKYSFYDVLPLMPLGYTSFIERLILIEYIIARH